jgi:Flp pilus assembly protein TadG
MKLPRIGGEKGTSVIEFALLAPVLMLLLIGLIEVGRYTYFAILAAHAARAGVQYGAQTIFTAGDNTGMKNAALADAQNLPGLTARGSHFCMSSGAVVSCPSGQPNSSTVYYVQVQVTGPFSSIFHYPGIPASITVNSTATMRVAGQ